MRATDQKSPVSAAVRNVKGESPRAPLSPSNAYSPYAGMHCLRTRRIECDYGLTGTAGETTRLLLQGRGVQHEAGI